MKLHKYFSVFYFALMAFNIFYKPALAIEHPRTSQLICDDAIRMLESAQRISLDDSLETLNTLSALHASILEKFEALSESLAKNSSQDKQWLVDEILRFIETTYQNYLTQTQDYLKSEGFRVERKKTSITLFGPLDDQGNRQEIGLPVDILIIGSPPQNPHEDVKDLFESLISMYESYGVAFELHPIESWLKNRLGDAGLGALNQTSVRLIPRRQKVSFIHIAIHELFHAVKSNIQSERKSDIFDIRFSDVFTGEQLNSFEEIRVLIEGLRFLLQLQEIWPSDELDEIELEIEIVHQRIEAEIDRLNAFRSTDWKRFEYFEELWSANLDSVTKKATGSNPARIDIDRTMLNVQIFLDVSGSSRMGWITPIAEGSFLATWTQIENKLRWLKAKRAALYNSEVTGLISDGIYSYPFRSRSLPTENVAEKNRLDQEIETLEQQRETLIKKYSDKLYAAWLEAKNFLDDVSNLIARTKHLNMENSDLSDQLSDILGRYH